MSKQRYCFVIYILCVNTFHSFNIKLLITYCGVSYMLDLVHVKMDKIQSLLYVDYRLTKQND